MSDTAAAPPTQETPEQALARAQDAARAKRFHEATGIARDVLTAHPNHPSATALVGIIAGMMGDPARAMTQLRKASGLQPGIAA